MSELIDNKVIDRDGLKSYAYQAFGNTNLHKAAFKGHEKEVATLLSSGADVDCVNKNGETALHISVRQGHLGVVKVLLTHHANIYKQNNAGKIPLYVATELPSSLMKNSHREIIELLVSADAKQYHKYRKIWDAASSNVFTAIKKLFQDEKKSNGFFRHTDSEIKDILQFINNEANCFTIRPVVLAMLKQQKQLLLSNPCKPQSHLLGKINFAIATLQYEIAKKELAIANDAPFKRN